MPLEVGVWRVDSELQRISPVPLEFEARLQELLAQDIAIANPGWMVLGREVSTDFGGRIDILAIDSSGSLIVIELKRDRTPRDIVAQVLDYGSWVTQLRPDQIGGIFSDYRTRFRPDDDQLSLDEAFRERFGQDHGLESLNTNHELVVVAAELDPATERIVGYLSEAYNVGINVLFFQVFADGERQYLVRAWLRDPAQTETESTSSSARQTWNGEFYASFGEGESRRWSDALKYGFISGGGGHWYSAPLNMLNPGDRVWVHIASKGYVGVAQVISPAVQASEFKTSSEGTATLLSDLPVEATSMFEKTEPEYLVAFRWVHTENIDGRVWETGFFANQTTVARPRASNWPFTVDRLKTRFKIDS